MFLLTTAGGFAADLPGSSDHPQIKRFAGSEIVGWDVRRFAHYWLQTSTYKEYDFETHRRKYASPPLELEGRVTRIWYEAAGNVSAARLADSYRNELITQGFCILYDSSKDAKFVQKRRNFLAVFAGIDIKSSCREYVFVAADAKKVRILSAVKKRAEGDLYVHVTTVEWAEDTPAFTAKKGAYAAVDIIETKPIPQHMVVEKADKMKPAPAFTAKRGAAAVDISKTKPIPQHMVVGKADKMKPAPAFTAKREASAAVDTSKTKSIPQHMVVGKADKMAKELAAKGRVVVYGILFDTDSARLRIESKAAIEEIARLLQQKPTLLVHIVGHTDNVGNLRHNLTLSRQRAEAIKTVLVDHYEIASHRLTPNGVASLAPVATNTSEEGRAKNRRIELVLQ